MFLWIGVCVYCVLIFFASSIPGNDVDTGPPGVDKLLHLIEYLILSYLSFFAVRVQFPGTASGRVFLFAFVFSTVYGISDEIHQYYVPLRECDPLDVVMDGLGSALGAYWALVRSCRGDKSGNE
ncbi:MAG: VanZ family protein [Deltaproteobacteria bacterium]|nr:VanZ family protein [Candidatus Zymogenaceae bacterium]